MLPTVQKEEHSNLKWYENRKKRGNIERWKNDDKIFPLALNSKVSSILHFNLENLAHVVW